MVRRTDCHDERYVKCFCWCCSVYFCVNFSAFVLSISIEQQGGFSHIYALNHCQLEMLYLAVSNNRIWLWNNWTWQECCQHMCSSGWTVVFTQVSQHIDHFWNGIIALFAGIGWMQLLLGALPIGRGTLCTLILCIPIPSVATKDPRGLWDWFVIEPTCRWTLGIIHDVDRVYEHRASVPAFSNHCVTYWFTKISCYH